MSIHQEHYERLKQIVLDEGVKIGKVRLASGAIADYYIDCRSVTTHPEGAYRIAEIILDMIADDDVDALGGPTLGADPIVGAVCYASHCRNRPLPGFIVRKEAKGHGMQKMIEGHMPEGAKVVVVEDVLTSGGSVLKAVRAIEEAGGTVVRIVGIVDRQAGASTLFRKAGYELSTIFTKDDLGLA
ncbi:orotate phosphoribosyltransferase [bacterium]|nr:orotate phosphoribosyltransferase [bacterium]